MDGFMDGSTSTDGNREVQTTEVASALASQIYYTTKDVSAVASVLASL